MSVLTYRKLSGHFLRLIYQKEILYAAWKARRSLHTFTPLSQNRTESRNTVYLIDENEDKDTSLNTLAKHNLYTYRTYTCGELSQQCVGERVILCGWLEFQRMNKFAVLRDGYGRTQIMFKEDDSKSKSCISALPFESIIRVEGTVLSRPKDMVNPDQTTGEIEVLVDSISVLNPAKEQLPFNVREFQRANESLRLQYRYLDLRFADMQRNLRVRSQMLMRMREFLVNKAGFVDVETPTLFKATPGGAQEFIVPTKFPGQFYSLVQSPQQFKQMLMAGGIDRYFQIARCYRDETSRPDRQPEFTQLDIELSFTGVEEVLTLTEDLLQYCWPEFHRPLPTRFPRMSYKDALEKYGTDKPDLRIPFVITDCSDILAKSTNNAMYCIAINHEYSGEFSKSVRKEMTKFSQHFPATKLFMKKFEDVETFIKDSSFIFDEPAAVEFKNRMELKCNDLVFIAFGAKNDTLQLLGKIRTHYAAVLVENGINVISEENKVLWLIDWPLFEENAETKKLESCHHPFTAPNPEDMQLLDKDPLKVRSLSYDLVLNGHEIAGGSIRNHDPDVQRRILRKLDIDPTSLQHVLDMLASGCPPHGGIALGLDRLMSVVLGTRSIRDVIAFPKTGDGRDLLSGAPSAITEADEKLYNIKCVVDKDKV